MLQFHCRPAVVLIVAERQVVAANVVLELLFTGSFADVVVAMHVLIDVVT